MGCDGKLKLLENIINLYSGTKCKDDKEI